MRGSETVLIEALRWKGLGQRFEVDLKKGRSFVKDILADVNGLDMR